MRGQLGHHSKIFCDALGFEAIFGKEERDERPAGDLPSVPQRPASWRNVRAIDGAEHLQESGYAIRG